MTAQYEELLADHTGTDREAALVQHLGKAHFAAGHYDEAASCFERALRLRSTAGSDPSLLASSQIALDEARRRTRVTQAHENDPRHPDAPSETSAQ